MHKIVIGISGKAGSGKDTLAEFISTYLEKYEGSVDTVKVSFAGPLKEMAVKYFPFCDAVKKDPVSRQTLQGLGTLMREQVSENYWVDTALKFIEEDSHSVDTRVYLITDLRYENEAEALQSMNFAEHAEVSLVRINGRKQPMGEHENHPSEMGLDNYKGFHYFVINDGELSVLEEYAAKIAEHVIRKEPV